jgi:hypothetical protein
MSAVARDTLIHHPLWRQYNTYTLTMQMEKNVKSCEVLMTDLSVSCFIRTTCQFQG